MSAPRCRCEEHYTVMDHDRSAGAAHPCAREVVAVVPRPVMTHPYGPYKGGDLELCQPCAEFYRNREYTVALK